MPYKSVHHPSANARSLDLSVFFWFLFHEFLYVTRHPWKQQILVGVVRHSWAHPKWWQKWVCLTLKMSWVMKWVLCLWLGINRSNKLIQSFQVGVVRCSQSDSKQWFRMNIGMKLIRMNLVMKLIFCIWLGTHKHISLIQSIHMGVVRHTWEFQK